MKKLIFIAFSVMLFYWGIHQYEEWHTSETLEQASNVKQYTEQMKATAPAPPRPRTGVAAFAPVPGNSPLEVAESYFRLHREEYQIQPHHQAKPSVIETPMGAIVTYSFFQDQLPISGMELKIQLGRDHAVKSVENHYRPIPIVDIRPQSHPPVRDVMERLTSRYELENDRKLSGKVLYFDSEEDDAVLAYVVRVRDKTKPKDPLQVIVRASDGQVLAKRRPRSEFN